VTAEPASRSTSPDRRKLDAILGAWRSEDKISTLPEWAQVQTKIIQRCKASLPEVDEETKKKITRELLLNIRCQSCERARSDSCNFSICIRGLMSGQPYWGVNHEH